MAKGINSYVRKGYRADVMSEPCCFWCGVKDGEFHVDHIVPPQFGGLPVRHNMVKACVRCNAGKNNRTLLEWRDHCIKKRGEVFYKTIQYLYRIPHTRVMQNRKVLDWLLDKVSAGGVEHSIWSHRIGKINLIING